LARPGGAYPQADFGSYPLKLDYHLNLSLKEQFSQLSAPLALFFRKPGQQIYSLPWPSSSFPSLFVRPYFSTPG
jgi:hypothetical protein